MAEALEVKKLVGKVIPLQQVLSSELFSKLHPKAAVMEEEYLSFVRGEEDVNLRSRNRIRRDGGGIPHASAVGGCQAC